MSEYVFRYASGYGCDMSDLMDGGRVTVGDYFASESTDHYGTLHEEIVRCRDCKHYHKNWWVLVTDVEHACLFWAEGVKVAPDGFCAWGERRKANERDQGAKDITYGSQEHG